MLMEATLLTAIEVMKNDFLCTTFGLVFIGCNMIFSGFFRKPSASPVWISWMCYVAPFRVCFVYQLSCCSGGSDCSRDGRREEVVLAVVVRKH